MMADYGIYRHSYVDKNGNIIDVYENGKGKLLDDDHRLTPVAAEAASVTASEGDDTNRRPAEHDG